MTITLSVISTPRAGTVAPRRLRNLLNRHAFRDSSLRLPCYIAGLAKVRNDVAGSRRNNVKAGEGCWVDMESHQVQEGYNRLTKTIRLLKNATPHEMAFNFLTGSTGNL